MTRNEALTLLGLSPSYTEDDLKKAYRLKARQYHPDIVGLDGHDMFVKINKANEVLSYYLKQGVCKLTHQSIFNIVRKF